MERLNLAKRRIRNLSKMPADVSQAIMLLHEAARKASDCKKEDKFLNIIATNPSLTQLRKLIQNKKVYIDTKFGRQERGPMHGFWMPVSHKDLVAQFQRIRNLCTVDVGTFNGYMEGRHVYIVTR